MTKNKMYPHIDKPWMKFYEEEKINNEDPKTNLADYIKFKNQNNKNGIAETYYGTKISYNELFEKVDSFSKMS